MAVERIEKYRQKNGEDVLKVILKPTKNFPDGYFYCDASDEKLVRSYTWHLFNKKQPYVVADFRNNYSHQILQFHQEIAHNKLEHYLDCINHINGIEFDNVDRNLDPVTNQQNQWCRASRGYHKDKRCKSFESKIRVNSSNIYAKCVRTEAEACMSAHQLEIQYEDYRYDFLKDRRKDADILDLERTGQISEDEAIYRHVLRHAANNAWYYHRYNLADYFKDNHLKIPTFSTDTDGYMIHSVTEVRLCPL